VDQGNACSSLGVDAFLPTGERVGRANVHASSEHRCSYELFGLPADTPIDLKLQGGGWSCAGGASPAFTPDHATVQLSRTETRMLDFTSACGGPG
jgi:hypothetical protein